MPTFKVYFVMEQSMTIEAGTPEEAEDLAKVGPDEWSEPLLVEVEAV